MVAELDPMVVADAVVLCAHAAEELVRASFSADLMVVGSHGYDPLRGVRLGSVSGSVIGCAACPVMVIPLIARTRGTMTSRS